MAKTVIHQDLKSYFGSEDHLEVSQIAKFSDLIFEVLSEEKPTPEQSKLFELILNISIDHGPDTPSATKTIEAAKEGKTISESVAGGITQISDTHGGAIEPIMEIFYQLANHILHDRAEVVKNLVKEYLGSDKRMPGFGHRIYKDEDPRAQLILNKLKSFNLGEEFIKVGLELEAELQKQKGTKLPINVDGAIAVVLCTFGWSPKLGKAVFIIARTPGLCGQYLNNLI